MSLRRALAMGWVVPVVLLAGCGAAPPSVPSSAPLSAPLSAPSQPTVDASAAVPSAPVDPDPAQARPAAPPTLDEPVQLVVPAIGVQAGPLLRLGIDGRGALEVPPDAATAGWFTLGPTPGSDGPAVIAAHVDYGGVPGLFQRLHHLAPGDEIDVTRADGTLATFATYRVDRYPKAAFPSERVYGDTAGAELRLITCGGAFDDRTGQYRDNVVAYARLVRMP